MLFTELDTFAQVIPSMAVDHAIYMVAPVDRLFLEAVIEAVFLPGALAGLRKTTE